MCASRQTLRRRVEVVPPAATNRGRYYASDVFEMESQIAYRQCRRIHYNTGRQSAHQMGLAREMAMEAQALQLGRARLAWPRRRRIPTCGGAGCPNIRERPFVLCFQALGHLRGDGGIDFTGVQTSDGATRP